MHSISILDVYNSAKDEAFEGMGDRVGRCSTDVLLNFDISKLKAERWHTIDRLGREEFWQGDVCIHTYSPSK